MNNKVKLYGGFYKRDDEQHIVEGFATNETVDSQEEIVKIDAIEKALPEYLKFPTVREMHQWSAVGKTVSAIIDRAKKGLYIVAKVIDDTAWKKVKAGVYNGFSIGGDIVSKAGNVIKELTLNEISLVDRPSNPDAVYSMVKIDKEKDMTKDELIRRIRNIRDILEHNIREKKMVAPAASTGYFENMGKLYDEQV